MVFHRVTSRAAGWRWVVVFTAGALLGGLSMVEVLPASQVVTVAGPASAGVSTLGAVGATAAAGSGRTVRVVVTGASAAAGSAAGPAGSSGSGAAALGPAPVAGLACTPGRNGGATDRGVSATGIQLATTVAESGIGSAFLGEMRYGMQAVATQVNAAGGICGRRLDITYRDDGWNAATGQQYLEDFIHEGVFAIPVGASSEGLNAAIRAGDITSSQTPVVGTDGLAVSEYLTGSGSPQPWVWPVATATVASARIMVDDAYRRGARHFGIVFDSNYKFGVEAAAAFNDEVRRLTGHDVSGFNTDNTCQRLFCGIQAGQNSYSGYVSTFYSANPDFVALFLEPDTALTWMTDGNTPAADTGAVRYGYGAAQPLFTNQFEAQCQSQCDQMVVWTGFKPDVDVYQTDPAVEAYVSALQSVNPSADPYNQFTEGAYIGMQLLVQALRQVGPDLTRARLAAVLNTLDFRSGLTIQPSLALSATTRFANVTMQAFTMQYKGTPGGWRAGPIETDPDVAAGAG